MEIQRIIKKKIKTTRSSVTVNVLAYFLPRLFSVCMCFDGVTKLGTFLFLTF